MGTDVDIKNRIREYILESTFDDVENLSDETLIFEAGVLDSMGLLFLIEFLQEEYSISTNDDELVVENFQTINSIHAFVKSKM